jgi:prepilin-type N-terminal cleavage/methylation domain-containing protein
MVPEKSERGGFTLIEILAVILIVGILATILIVNLSEATSATRVTMTETKLRMLEGVINSYENEFGEYPPSSFTQEQGVVNSGTNCGVEALVVALWSNGWEAGGSLEADELRNVDGDRSARTLGDLGRELLELCDEWDNPIAYIHRQDYEVGERPYLTIDPETGEEIVSVPKPFRNPRTGRYYMHTKYQLISAGEDGEFGTADDLTPFDRE